MTAQKGKDLLLKVDTNGAGSFVTVAGLRARTLAFNAATVDVTDTESVGRWRELLDGAGVKTARITGSGIFKDASTDETVYAAPMVDVSWLYVYTWDARAVGDLSIVSLIRALSENWALIAGGFGVATLGAKIDRTGSVAKKTGETVSDIAGRALRR